MCIYLVRFLLEWCHVWRRYLQKHVDHIDEVLLRVTKPIHEIEQTNEIKQTFQMKFSILELGRFVFCHV